MLPNTLHYPIALFGVIKAGLVAVNTNPFYTQRECHYQFNNAEATVLVVYKESLPTVREILKDTKITRIIIADIDDDFEEQLILDEEELGAILLKPEISFQDAISVGRYRNYAKHDGKRDDVVLFQYTGGTTSASKGAMLTNFNLIINTCQWWGMMEPFQEPEKQQVSMCALPLYHIYAFLVNGIGMMS
jgi:long-chain acyl-CoA synthetase